MKIETQKQKQLVEEIIEMLEGFKDEDYLLNPDTSIALLNSVQKKLQQALEEKRMKEGMAYYNLQEAEGGEAMNKEELKEKLIKKFNGGEYVMTYEVIAELCMEAIQELEEAEEEEDKVIIAGREYVPKQQLKEEREKRVDNRYLLERFRKRLEEKKERIDGLEQQREMMGQEIEWRKNNEEALKQEVEGLERKLESKNNRVEELEEKLGKRNKELRAIKSALDSDNPVKELAKQKETTQYWGQEAMRLENLLKEKDQKIEELEEKAEVEEKSRMYWSDLARERERKIQQLKEEKPDVDDIMRKIKGASTPLEYICENGWGNTKTISVKKIESILRKHLEDKNQE